MTIEVGKVQMVPITKIVVSERARKDMGDLEGLELSLKQSGLAQPLSVMEQEDGTYLLLAGERRLTVLRKNNVEEVPVRIYPPGLNELEQKAIELAENFHRKDFTYAEYDDLISQIHELQLSIHGPKLSTKPDAPGWSQAKTAELMGISRPAVVSALQRAEARKAMPELFASCKTQQEANKILDKLSETIIREALAKKLNEEMPADERIRRLTESYIVGDFFELIKKVPDKVINLVEIDPPYGIDLKGQKSRGEQSAAGIEHYNEIDSNDYPAFLSALFTECYRVMTEHSWLICWFGQDPWFETVYQLLTKAGFKLGRIPGIWAKPSGQSNNPVLRLSNCYETFFYAYKGTPTLAKQGRSNVFNFPQVPPQKKTHPTERPVELMKELYSTFAFNGARILIPFLGSGSGLIAAYELGMPAFGYELSTEYRDAFLLRIHS